MHGKRAKITKRTIYPKIPEMRGKLTKRLFQLDRYGGAM